MLEEEKAAENAATVETEEKPPPLGAGLSDEEIWKWYGPIPWGRTKLWMMRVFWALPFVVSCVVLLVAAIFVISYTVQSSSVTAMVNVLLPYLATTTLGFMALSNLVVSLWKRISLQDAYYVVDSFGENYGGRNMQGYWLKKHIHLSAQSPSEAVVSAVLPAGTVPRKEPIVCVCGKAETYGIVCYHNLGTGRVVLQGPFAILQTPNLLALRKYTSTPWLC